MVPIRQDTEGLRDCLSAAKGKGQASLQAGLHFLQLHVTHWEVRKDWSPCHAKALGWNKIEGCLTCTCCVSNFQLFHSRRENETFGFFLKLVSSTLLSAKFYIGVESGAWGENELLQLGSS